MISVKHYQQPNVIFSSVTNNHNARDDVRWLVIILVKPLLNLGKMHSFVADQGPI